MYIYIYIWSISRWKLHISSDWRDWLQLPGILSCDLLKFATGPNLNHDMTALGEFTLNDLEAVLIVCRAI